MATKYISPSGAGTQDGSSAANALSVSLHNAGSFSPGDVIRITSGTYASTLIPPSSGTAGNEILYLAESGAIFSKGVWAANTGAIYIGNKSHIVIDGDNVLIIRNTANGTGLANSVESCGIYLQETKFCTVKNLEISNIYVRSGTTEAIDGGYGIRSVNSNGNGVNDLLVTNCTIHDVTAGIGFDYGVGDHDFTFSDNTIYNVNWGIAGGDRGATCTLSGLRVTGNRIYGFSAWDDTVANSFHHNGIFVFADNGTLTAPEVYGNHIGPGFGGAYQTSGIYINGHVLTPRVYNNIIECDPGEYSANGLITIGSLETTTLDVFNNTLIGGGTGECIHISGTPGVAQTFNIQNNIGAGGGGGQFIGIYINGSITLNSDHNLIHDFAANPFSYSATSSSSLKSLPQWQALGFDTDAITSDPNLDAEYAPQAGSPAIDAGTDLSAYFTTDYNGDARNDPWDIGAIRYVNSMADSLTLTQTANTDPVAEVWYEREVGSGSFTHVVRRHSGPYPSQPVNGYERPAAWGKNNVWVYIFRDEGQDDETFIADSLS